MCAEDNMRVANPTTPANYFHLLRRQALSPQAQAAGGVHAEVAAAAQARASRRWRTSPPAPSSRCSATRDQRHALAPAAVKRVLLCSGKVYYDLFQARAERGITDTAIIRMEQLYPLPVDGAPGGAGAVPERRGLRLGAGGAGQPGRLVVRRAQPAGAPRRASGCGGSPARPRPPRRSARPRLHEVEQAALIEAALPPRLT